MRPVTPDRIRILPGMKTISNRLDKLKERVNPDEDPPFRVIWKVDGRYYLNSPYSPNGVGEEITPAQYEEFRRDTVFLVTYVDLIKL